MDKKKYILAIFWLLIVGQIVCISIVESFINLNIISNIDISVWRFSIIGFVIISMFFLPMLIYINNKEVIKNRKKQLENITNTYDRVFKELKGEIYLVNKNNKIIWLSSEAKKRIKNKYSLVNASLVHEKFKQAYLLPNKKHFFQEKQIAYEVIFYKELDTYFCLNINNKTELERSNFNNKEVMGFLEVRHSMDNNLLDFKTIRDKFIESIKKWAHQYKIVITNIGSLNFIIYMRTSSFLQMKNEEFSVIKQLDKFLKTINKNYIIQLSLATSGSNTLINAELARSGLLEVRSKKNNSLIILQDAELNSFKIIDVNIKDSLEIAKETSVIPEGFSYQTYESIKKERDGVPIALKLSLNKKEKTFGDVNSFINNINEKEEQIIKKEPPEWLKKVLNKSIQTNQEKNLNKEKLAKQNKKFKYSLIEEIEKMFKIICFFSNGSNKNEFFMALLFYIVIKKLKLNYYVYFEIPFTFHHSLKMKLKEFQLLNFQKSIVDAFTLKRIEKANTFYLFFKKNNLNKNFMDTTTSHRVAYINSSINKSILEILFENIKNELLSLKFKKNELNALIFFAKKTKEEGKCFLDLFTKIRDKNN